MKSGKFVVRIKPDLHEWLCERANKQGLTLNKYIVKILEKIRSLNVLPINAPTVKQSGVIQQEQRLPHYENAEYLNRVKVTGSDEERYDNKRKHKDKLDNDELEEFQLI